MKKTFNSSLQNAQTTDNANIPTSTDPIALHIQQATLAHLAKQQVCS
jgi:hypothetical protein